MAQEVEQLKTEVDAANARNSLLENRVKDLEKDLVDTPVATIHKFLGSLAFKHAAIWSYVGMLKSIIYNVLKDVGRYFPIIPEMMGFDLVNRDKGNTNHRVSRIIPGIWMRNF